MKNSKNYVMTSPATLTQSGLLAVLLQRQRHKVIESAERRAHRSQLRSAFSNTLTWLLARVRGATQNRCRRSPRSEL